MLYEDSSSITSRKTLNRSLGRDQKSNRILCNIQRNHASSSTNRVGDLRFIEIKRAPYTQHPTPIEGCGA